MGGGGGGGDKGAMGGIRNFVIMGGLSASVQTSWHITAPAGDSSLPQQLRSAHSHWQ